MRTDDEAEDGLDKVRRDMKPAVLWRMRMPPTDEDG
jgi:hypothetical protein